MRNLPTAPAGTTTPESGSVITITVACPTWCTNDHSVIGPCIMEAGNGSLVTTHDGPLYGPFSAGGEVDIETGRLTVDIGFDAVVLAQRGLDGTNDPAKLRQVAAEALAAAEWLEAQR